MAGIVRACWRVATWPLRIVGLMSSSSGPVNAAAAGAHWRPSLGRLDVVDYGGVRTETLTFDPVCDEEHRSNVVIVMLPGNPGSPAFYATFMERLFLNTGGSVACVVLGHANHSTRSAVVGTAFNLAQQVEHKAAFFRQLLTERPGSKLILLGHSVGAYMALEVARTLPQDALLKVVALFPTVAHIGATVNGKRLLPLFRYGKTALYLLAALVALLPERLQRLLARWQLPAGADPMTVEATMSLLHPTVAYNALFLALHEMHEIAELDTAHVGALAKKLVFYFGESDDWVLAGTPDAIRSSVPDATVLRCAEGHRHAFVLSTSSAQRVADLSWSWLAPAIAAEAAAVEAGREEAGEALRAAAALPLPASQTDSLSTARSDGGAAGVGLPLQVAGEASAAPLRAEGERTALLGGGDDGKGLRMRRVSAPTS